MPSVGRGPRPPPPPASIVRGAVEKGKGGGAEVNGRGKGASRGDLGCTGHEWERDKCGERQYND